MTSPNTILQPDGENISVNGLTVRNAKVSTAFVFDIPEQIDSGKIETRSIGNKVVYILPSGLFLLEYIEQGTRDTDGKLFSESFKKDGFFAEKLPEGYQIPENAGEFEYDGKYFLIVNSYNSTIETTDTFSINGVVLDVPSYRLTSATREKVLSSLGES